MGQISTSFNKEIFKMKDFTLFMKYIAIALTFDALHVISPDTDAGAHLGAVIVDTDVAAECLAQVDVTK